MKRISITRAFLVIIVIVSILIGASLAFIVINPNVLGLLSSGERVTISKDDYNYLIALNNKYGKAELVWNRIANQFYTDVDPQQLQDYMIKGLVSATDDIYSGYYTAKEYEDLMVSLTGEYDGVGITMVQAENGYIQVHGVTKKSPAQAGGVQVGEYITKVDGKFYTADTMDLAAAAVRGDAGTTVTITFVDENNNEIERKFVRAHITSDTIDSKMLADNIAYIQVSSFENATAKDFKTALNSLSGADSLIIDLRDNPGGLVESAVEIADMFMDNATLVYTQNHNGDKEYFKTKDGKIWDKPFVVLVNENSASASEIFAAGIKENNIARIVGTKTYGKGIIQSIEPLPDGSALKLTMWQYFTPRGIAIHKVGIEPEYIVEDPDEQLQKAIDLLKK